jgi:hypothetical protein
MKRVIVLTTINVPTKAIVALKSGAEQQAIPFVVVGDTKTPADSYHDYAHYYSIARQQQQFPNLGSALPNRHYARKNAGYVAAMALGAEEIQETDDDNIPLEAFWQAIPDCFMVDAITTKYPWFNVYSLFSEQLIWPRGYPLEHIRAKNPYGATPHSTRGLIIQDLADNNPDVDAVYRFTCSLPIRFTHRITPVMLSSGVWCPFNTQNTIFRREAFPLLYLPSCCSFRMTDIWRSFVAQRCLWELGEGIIFRNTSVYQERNSHELLKDFEDEIPGYLLNDRIRAMLESMNLERRDMIRNLVLCYEALIANEIIPSKEMQILKSWSREIEAFVQ